MSGRAKSTARPDVISGAQATPIISCKMQRALQGREKSAYRLGAAVLIAIIRPIALANVACTRQKPCKRAIVFS